MRPRQFVTLLNASRKNTYSPGTHLTEQGKDLDKVYLLLEGKLNITVDKEVVAVMKADDSMCFIGEMNLLQRQKITAAKDHAIRNLADTNEFTGGGSSATVIVSSDGSAQVLEWDKVRGHFMASVLI